MTNGGSIVYLHPAANREFGNRAQCVGAGWVAAFHAINCEGMVFTDDLVRALLAVIAKSQ